MADTTEIVTTALIMLAVSIPCELIYVALLKHPVLFIIVFIVLELLLIAGLIWMHFADKTDEKDSEHKE